MHNQLSATWSADWGALPERIITVIEANNEDFQASPEKTVEIWANLFQEAGLAVAARQGFYDPHFSVERKQWQQDRFAHLADQEHLARSYWLVVDGYLIDPNGAHNPDHYYPYWSWPGPTFDDLMWQEDWQPLEADTNI